MPADVYVQMHPIIYCALTTDVINVFVFFI